MGSNPIGSTNLVKILIIFVIFVVFLLVALSVSPWFTKGRRHADQALRSQADGEYLSLRDQALQGSRVKFGLSPTTVPTEPWGVIMDWGVEAGATATVVALSDRSASIYLSSGGGSIGGGSHDKIRNAAKTMVAVAAQCQPQTTATTSFPLPKQGEIIFYLLTDAGVFTARGSEEEVSSHRHPLSKLGDTAQIVIKQYQLI